MGRIFLWPGKPGKVPRRCLSSRQTTPSHPILLCLKHHMLQRASSPAPTRTVSRDENMGDQRHPGESVERLASANSTGWAGRGPCTFKHTPWGQQVRLERMKKWNYRTHPSKYSKKTIIRHYRWARNLNLQCQGSLIAAGANQLCWRWGTHTNASKCRWLWIPITDNFQAFFNIKLTIYPLVSSANSNLFLNGDVFKVKN